MVGHCHSLILHPGLTRAWWGRGEDREREGEHQSCRMVTSGNAASQPSPAQFYADVMLLPLYTRKVDSEYPRKEVSLWSFYQLVSQSAS